MQAFEAEVRQQLKRPQGLIDAQVAAAQAECDFAQSSDTFDHKLVMATQWEQTNVLAEEERNF